MKFSINTKAADDRKVYGYLLKDGATVYWKDGSGIVRYFSKASGGCGVANEQTWCRYSREPNLYTPIYEPFSITIGE